MLLMHEGGFTDDRFDPGNDDDGYGNAGSTNMGVTSKVYAEFTGQPAPIEVMRKLTVADVKPIYKKNYWDRVRADDLPSGVDWSTFDWQVNSGSTSAKALQRNVGAKPDGIIGSLTLQAIKKHDPEKIVRKIHSSRDKFYRSLDLFDKYGKGWIFRNDKTLKSALYMLKKKSFFDKLREFFLL